MSIATRACDTISDVPKPPDPEREHHAALLAAGYRAKVAADKAAERKRDELAAAIADAYRTGKFKAAAIAKLVNYTPEHVRRILRAHGIEGDPNRITPTQRLKRQAEDS